jgi:hypothetical protein
MMPGIEVRVEKNGFCEMIVGVGFKELTKGQYEMVVCRGESLEG